MNPDYAEILSALFAENAEFIIVGAFALAAHGAPRTTGHIDLWVNPDPANARRVWQALLKFGAPLVDFSPDDFSKPDVVFQMGVPPVRIDILTSIDGVEWNDAWAGRVVKEVEGVHVPILSGEHIIRNKRATGRPQDLVDVERLERRQSKKKGS